MIEYKEHLSSPSDPLSPIPHSFEYLKIICVLNCFMQGFKQVELIIKSKPLKWSNDGGFYPIQHLIFLKAYSGKHLLFGTEALWPCKSSLKKQIFHWRSRMISRQLDSKIYNSSNYKLIVENNIQKIISSNDLRAFFFFNFNVLILLMCKKESTSKRSKLENNLKIFS